MDYRRTLRFATFLAPNMYPVYEFVTRYVGQKLGRRTELIVGSSFDQFAAGEADVGFICGLPYVELADEPEPPVELLAAPVLEGERYQNRPIYYSDVIVRRDSPFRSFADLRGCTWAYNEPESHLGYNVTRYHLVKMGETRDFFGEVVAAGAHQRAIRLVCRGEVDASVIDSQVLAVELRDHPQLQSQLRVIDALGPAAIQPVVAASRLPRGLKTAVKGILLAMDEDPAVRAMLAHGFVSHFAPVTDADYDDIREMVAAAEATGYRTLA
jgi:phosphonate transport system substrate-binding protein